MRNSFLSVMVTLIIVGFGANLFSNHILNRLDSNETAIRYSNAMLSDIEKSIQEIKVRAAETISSNELRNAYISIEDNKRFFEYEVKMSRKSIAEFISKLNVDMEQLNDMVNKNNSNNQILEDKLNYVLQEIELLQEPQEIIEEPVVAPESLDTIRGTTTIESYREESCAFELKSGSQNKTKVIQKAVDKTRRRGAYNLIVLFNVNKQGVAEIFNVNSNNAPTKLKSAVHSYVSKLKFVPKDVLQTNCEMSFNLNVT
tara:strand:- start:6319 stop:7089 length:771 start_codon:yes stop_codon:yes gene_type:complete